MWELCVSNVVTLYNVFRACEGSSVISRPVTITGEVNNPVTLNIPIGLSIREAISFAGGIKIEDYAVIRGGPMMGKVVEDLEQPVIKTDSSFIVFTGRALSY